MSEQRLIDAKALGDKIMKMPFYTWKDCENVLFEILSAPTIDPVKHGKWELLDECSNDGVYCSVCHKKVYRKEYANQKMKSPYCPNCGARMDKE